MDDATYSLYKVLWVMLAPKGETTTKLAIYHLDMLKEKLQTCEDFPNLQLIKRELDKVYE